MLPKTLITYLIENDYGAVTDIHPVAGGCISNAKILTVQSGATFFLKHNQKTPADMFTCEAKGLAALHVSGGPTVPRVYLDEREFILLEDLKSGPHNQEYWPTFGRQLAKLHNHTNFQFGFDHDNYIGSTRQLNPWTDDGHTFFAEFRLLYQAQMAHKRGLLGKGELRDVERIAGRLVTLVPNQPASIIHGDLWSGNAITDSSGAPAIIDPAAHYGWAEAELAMTSLFGTFPTTFFRAYEEIRPLEPSYQARFPIYNLYHLLNHLNIFGRGYLSQVKSILRRYSSPEHLP
jgi:fructosamine-3-kinase